MSVEISLQQMEGKLKVTATNSTGCDKRISYVLLRFKLRNGSISIYRVKEKDFTQGTGKIENGACRELICMDYDGGQGKVEIEAGYFEEASWWTNGMHLGNLTWPIAQSL